MVRVVRLLTASWGAACWFDSDAKWLTTCGDRLRMLDMVFREPRGDEGGEMVLAHGLFEGNSHGWGRKG